MEKTLERLFDFQKFAENEELAAVIDAVHARYSSTRRRALSLEETEWVNAAGDANYLPPEQEKGKDRV